MRYGNKGSSPGFGRSRYIYIYIFFFLTFSDIRFCIISVEESAPGPYFIFETKKMSQIACFHQKVPVCVNNNHLGSTVEAGNICVCNYLLHDIASILMGNLILGQTCYSKFR